MNKKRTDTLIRELQKEKQFNNFCRKNDEEFAEISLCQYLEELCRDKNVVAERVINAAAIDRTYGHQLFNGTRKPSRDKAIQLAFGFGLSVEETQRLLHAADKGALYPRIKRDAAIIFALSKGMSFMEAQDFLFSIGVEIIGEVN